MHKTLYMIEFLTLCACSWPKSNKCNQWPQTRMHACACMFVMHAWMMRLFCLCNSTKGTGASLYWRWRRVWCPGGWRHLRLRRWSYQTFWPLGIWVWHWPFRRCRGADWLGWRCFRRYSLRDMCWDQAGTNIVFHTHLTVQLMLPPLVLSQRSFYIHRHRCFYLRIDLTNLILQNFCIRVLGHRVRFWSTSSTFAPSCWFWCGLGWLWLGRLWLWLGRLGLRHLWRRPCWGRSNGTYFRLRGKRCPGKGTWKLAHWQHAWQCMSMHGWHTSLPTKNHSLFNSFFFSLSSLSSLSGFAATGLDELEGSACNMHGPRARHVCIGHACLHACMQKEYIYILYCYIACWKWIAINECMQLGSCCGANAARLCITCRMFGSWQGQHIMIDVYKIISKNMHAWKICKIVLSKAIQTFATRLNMHACMHACMIRLWSF